MFVVVLQDSNVLRPRLERACPRTTAIPFLSAELYLAVVLRIDHRFSTPSFGFHSSLPLLFSSPLHNRVEDSPFFSDIVDRSFSLIEELTFEWRPSFSRARLKKKKILSGLTLLRVTPGVTWTQLYIYMYVCMYVCMYALFVPHH